MNQNKKNLYSSIVSFILSVVQSLWYVSFIKKNLGVEIYGYTSVVTSIINFSTVLSIAITAMSSRFINISLVKKDYLKANKYFNTVIFTTRIITGILLFIYILIIFNIKIIMKIEIQYVNDIQLSFLFSGISLLLSILSTPFIACMHNKNVLDKYYIFISLNYVLRIFFPIIINQFGFLSIWNMPLGGMIADVLAYIYYSRKYKKYTPKLFINKRFIDRKSGKEIVRSGIWISITKTGALLQNTLNTYFSNIYVSAYITGIYASMIQFQNLVIVFSNTLINCFVPRMYKIYANKNEFDLFLYAGQVIIKISIMIGIICSMILVYGIDFMNIWLIGDYSDYVILLNLMIGILPFSVISEVLNQINITVNKIKISAVFTFICGLLNILLIIIFNHLLNIGVYSIVISQVIVLLFKGYLLFPIYTSHVVKVKIRKMYSILSIAPLLTFALYWFNCFCKYIFLEFTNNFFCLIFCNIISTFSIIFILTYFIFKLSPKKLIEFFLN